MVSPLVSVQHLTKRYGPRTAIDNLSFSVNKGEVIGFLGPNGAGKTTTMNILTGFIAPSDGEVTINGISLQDNPEAAKRHLGYLPETPPLYPDMSVRDYLQFVGRLRGLARNRLPERYQFVLERCGLTDVSERVIGHLSKGYRQRVGIAQAVIADPAVIILDEPTVGLDPLQIIEIRDLIKDLGKDHTLILSTHILPEVTMTCQKIIIINEGKIVAEDSYEALSLKLRESHKLYIQGAHINEDKMRAFRAHPGVISAVPVSETGAGGYAWIVESAKNIDLETLVIQCAAKEMWGLKEMRPYQLSLEEVFLKLTREEVLS